jgi:ATP dependent DNA ligase-like protein
MHLPFAPPLQPMLSSAARALPAGDGWLFEPKWDGFRTLVFRDGDEILLQSRDEKPMNRYFPELLAPLADALPERCVVDGEIVIVGAGGLDFEALLLRINPAVSRVKYDHNMQGTRFRHAAQFVRRWRSGAGPWSPALAGSSELGGSSTPAPAGSASPEVAGPTREGTTRSAGRQTDPRTPPGPAIGHRSDGCP